MASGDQWAWGHDEASGEGLHVSDQYPDAERNIKAGCPPLPLCCDNLPPTHQAMVRVTEPDSGGPGDITLACEEITMTLDPVPEMDGKRRYDGMLSGDFSPYFTDLNVHIWCDNVNQIPGEVQDCDTAIIAQVDGKLLIRDAGCCCDPFCFSGSTPASAPAPPDANIDAWFFEVDTDGNVACEPSPRFESPCPQEPALLKECGGGPVAVELTFLPAEARALASAIAIELDGETVEVTFLPAEARAVANPITLEIEPSGSDNCCDGPPDTLSYDIYMEFTPEGQQFPICVEQKGGSLQEEPSFPTQRIWSAMTSNDPRFSPSSWSVRCTCNGLGEICEDLLAVNMNNSVVLPRFDCSCTPAFAITTSQTNVTLADLGIALTTNLTPQGPGPGDEAETAVWMYVKNNAVSASADRPPNACTPNP